LPEGATLFGDDTRDLIIENHLSAMMNDFVDGKRGTCSFDSPEFARLLEFIKTCRTWEDRLIFSYPEEPLRTDMALAARYHIGGYDAYVSAKYAYGNVPLTFIGFPNSRGATGSMILPDCEYAISAKSENVPGAWQFIKYLLSDEYAENSYGLPLKRSRLEQLAAEAMRPYVTWYDGDGNPHDEPRRYYDQETGVSTEYKAEKSDIDALDSIIGELNEVMRFDATLTGIIGEETLPFFAGQRGAQETANIIQSRAQVYIAESR
jgi:ABC-type glycerol-3-phosphate transport system substrate-binding protein